MNVATKTDAQITEGVSRGLQATGIIPEHAWEVARAAIHSLWITGTAVFLGSLVQSFADGAHSPSGYIGWWHDGHGYGYLIAAVITPLLRGRFALVQLQKSPPPATP